MPRTSKFPEQLARMPEVQETRRDEIVTDYIQSVTSQTSESAKSHRFLILLKYLFGIQPEFIEDYVSGIEKFIKVRQKDRILRGEVDNLFGNLIIEFERDLKKKLGEAEEQLKRYVACLWSQEVVSQRRPYLCLATDGVNFAIYSPIVIDPEKTEFDPAEISLNLIEQVDWSQLSPQEVYFWLDRYFLRKEILSPKSEHIIKDFGAKSHAFQMVSQSILSCWERLKEKSEYRVIYESWEKYLQIVYGSTVIEAELFCRHTYLATLAKLMAWNRLSEGKFDNNLITAVLSGRFFKDQGIENFLEEDFFSWVVRDDAKYTGLENSRLLMSLLKNYNLKELSEDVLKSLYQELVDPQTRHDLGEFYTPDWLAHRIIRKFMDENSRGSFLDPSCGSGTFLYLTIREKRNRLHDSTDTLEHILDSVFGIDIHPLAVIVAKTNYILALGDLLRIRGRINIPIYLSDTIRATEKERAKDVKIPVWFNGNVYRVKFDFVIGNPPWLSFRYAEPTYQKFLNEQITKNYHLLSGRGELITHLELGTLFFLRSADLYLKDSGKIAFVLPRSIFTSDQHDGLRAGAFKGISITLNEIWDLEKVSPLFKVPSCVLIAEKKRDSRITYPVPGKKINGKLYYKNSSLQEAEANLSEEEVKFYLHKRGKRSYWDTEKHIVESKQSYYKKHFFQGATIVPRSFWFADLKVTPSLGFDPELPPLESSARARREAKNAYKDLVVRGTVESKYLYATLLSTDLLPFVHLDYRLVILPIEPLKNRYHLINAEEARNRQYIHLVQWLEKAEEEWEKRRGVKAKAMSIYDRLDRYRGLTKQNPQTKLRILYNTSGTFLCACIVKNELIEFDFEGQVLQTNGYVVDTKTYYMETNDNKEGQYLAAVLNAPIIDKLIKPMQSRGQWGPRDIHKKVLELPIPKFVHSNTEHFRLVEIGKKCSEKVPQWIDSVGTGKIKSIGVLRRKVREMLSEELKEIDELVRKIL